MKFKLIVGAIALLTTTQQANAVLEATIVSGIRAEQSELSTPASITIITREQIEASGARHIVDALRGRTTIQVSDRVGDGSGASISMRGFGDSANANTLILVDDRKLNNTDIAPADLNSIPLQDVERIEIIDGSAGVLFGDQAVGGVINIITARAGADYSRIAVSLGSYDAKAVHAVKSGSTEKIDYRFSANVRESLNYRDNNAIQYGNLFGKIGGNHDNGRVFAELMLSDEDLQAPGALFAADAAMDRRQVISDFAEDYSDVRTRMTRFGVEQHLDDDWSLLAELTHRVTDGDFRLSFAGFGPQPSATQDRSLVEFTPRLVGLLPSLGNTQLTLGYDQSLSDYNLTSLFGRTDNDQLIQSVYVQAVYPATSSLNVTAGARYARVDNELIDDFDFAGGMTIKDKANAATLGLSYQLNEKWRWLFRVDDSFRFPKVDEYTSAQPFTSPAFVILDTQTGRSVETGVEWSGQSHSGKALIYQLELEDELVFDGASFVNQNIDETRRKGIVLENTWAVNKSLNLVLALSRLDADIKSGVFAGNRVPYVAEATGKFAIDYRANESWRYYLETTGTSDRVASGDFANNFDLLSGYAVTNAQLQYRHKEMTVSLKVNNLFDRLYSDYAATAFNSNSLMNELAFYPSPERNLMVTISIDLE